MIGFEPEQTSILKLSRTRRAIEDLAAAALLEGGELAEQYERLRNAPCRGKIVNHPVFESMIIPLLSQRALLATVLRLLLAESHPQEVEETVSIKLDRSGV